LNPVSGVASPNDRAQEAEPEAEPLEKRAAALRAIERSAGFGDREFREIAALNLLIASSPNSP
jgi:hypothetical protein